MRHTEITKWIKKGEEIFYIWSGQNATQKQWEQVKAGLQAQMELEKKIKRYKQYRDNGWSYLMIAEMENLTKSAVSNFCRRHELI